MEMTALRATIAANLAGVQDRLAAAAARAGRPLADIRLIAVSKTQPPAAVAAAIAAGQRVFGENTVQDALAKIPQFPTEGLEWHFLGHLQSNKAKHIPGNFAWLHSLDSASLAERVARLARERATHVDCLIEVNVTGDPAKHGIAPAALLPLIEELAHRAATGIRLRGLMTIGPHPAGEAERRAAFARLRLLRDECRTRFGLADFTELSMGMSDDFGEAIQEGATMIRVGTAIFGERDYAK